MGEVEALDKRPKTNARKEHEVQKPQVYPSRTAATLVLLAFLSFFSAGFAQTKVTFWTWVGLEPAVEQFEAANPDIDVELVTFGPWDLHDKLLTALAVAQLVTRRFDAYRDTGQLVDLAPYLDEEYMSQVPASIWPAVSSGDGIYGVPTDYGPGVIWYRKDVFEEYGIEAPISTWEEFIEAGKIVREESNGEQYMMPLYIPSGQWGVASFVQFLQSAGGNLYDESGNVKDERHFDNLIVSAGVEGVASRIAPHDGPVNSSAPYNYIALGTSNTAADAAQTALVAELPSGASYARVQDATAQYTTSGGNKVILSVTFLPNQATGTLRESGIFNAASGGNMLARQAFAAEIQKAATDTLTVTWTITLSPQ